MKSTSTSTFLESIRTCVVNAELFCLILSNLVAPYGLEQPRVPIDINFLIYSADILVKTETGRFASLKNRLLGNLNIGAKPAETEDNESQIDEQTAVVINLLSDQPAIENPDLAHLNTFVQITFNGVTVGTVYE